MHIYKYTHIDNFLKNYFISCVWVFGLHACLCIICGPGANEEQKVVLDARELEL